MKAVGETMAIGRTFRSAWQKGLRGLEIDRAGWVTADRLEDDGLSSDDRDSLLAALRKPTAERPFQLKRALQRVVDFDGALDSSVGGPSPPVGGPSGDGGGSSHEPGGSSVDGSDSVALDDAPSRTIQSASRSRTSTRPRTSTVGFSTSSARSSSMSTNIGAPRR